VSSPKKTDSRLDLERDIPTTREDVEAMRRARRIQVSGDDWWDFVRQLTPPSHEELKNRRGPSGEPFEL
jgi:hypothetical protein